MQALLHDEPLQLVPPSAASTAGVSTAALDVAPADASSGPPIGLWNFDDCSPEFTNLFDFSFNNNTAFHGCHSAQETDVVFLQISPRSPGNEAILSNFLTGTTVLDPVTSAPRTFDDLGRRKQDLQAIVCPGQGARIATTLRKGISRVH